MTCRPGVNFPTIIDRPFLTAFVDQTVEDFCTCGFGKVGDEHNHCAHFVSHALGFRCGGLCNQMVWDYRNDFENGRTMRVNDLFNNCADRGLWADKPAELNSCLIFAVINTGIDTKTMTMGTQRRKHVGIYLNGECYNYHNTTDEGVKSDGDSRFRTLYGNGTLMLYGTFPP